MHLGLRGGPFASHINLWSPVALLKFQMAPRLKMLMSSGSKRGTEIYFSFSLKSPSKWTPSRFPNRVPVERDTCLQGILHISQNIIKIPLNKKSLRKKHPSMVPKSRAPMEADAHFEALLNISSGVPSKGAHISCLMNKLSLRIHKKQISLVGKTIKVLSPALCWICLS